MFVADVKSKSGWVNVAVAPEEKSAKDRLGHDIENPIENGLRVWRDDIAALTESPGDGVKEPKEDGPDTADGISAGDVVAEGDGVLASSPSDGPCNPKESGTAEDEIAPLESNKPTDTQQGEPQKLPYLVARLNECANETGDDHDLVK